MYLYGTPNVICGLSLKKSTFTEACLQENVTWFQYSGAFEAVVYEFT